MEAGSFTKNVFQNDTYYINIERYGRTNSGVTLFPVIMESQEATEEASYLEYDFYSFTSSYLSNISVVSSPSLNVNPYAPLRYAISIDDEEPQVLQIYEDNVGPTAYITVGNWELSKALGSRPLHMIFQVESTLWGYGL